MREGVRNGMEKRSSSARVISVVEVKTFIGNGTSDSPYQAVTEYWSLQGELLAVSKD